MMYQPKVNRIINASGKMTILGGSVVTKNVPEQLKVASQSFYLMEQLQQVLSADIAKLLGVEQAYIVASASAGIVQCVAASIAKQRLDLILNPYDARYFKREVIIAKGQLVDYGTSIEVPIRMGGGAIVEVGFANGCDIAHYESNITANTACIIYVLSHHAVQKSMVDVATVIKLGQRYGVPVIVDAAAEGDLTKYVKMGADAVIYSGTKALEGPTSGLVVGTESFLNLVKLQYQGLGRVLKIGKENMLALMQALVNYHEHTPVSETEQKQRLTTFNEQINTIPSLKATIVQDGAGRPIFRSQIHFKQPHQALLVSQHLKAGEVKIYTRDYHANENYLEIDIRDVSDEDLIFIYACLVQIMEEIRHES